MPYGYGSTSDRDRGSNYGQFDRAVSRTANNPSKSTPTRSRQESVAREEVSKSKAEPPSKGPNIHEDPIAVEQKFVDTKPKAEPPSKGPKPRNIHEDTGEEKEVYEMVGGVEVPLPSDLSMIGVKGVDPREDLDRYFEKPGRDPFNVPEGDLTIEEKREIEKFEGAQDWDLIKEMSDKGYDFEEIKKAVDKGLTLEAPTTDTRRQNLIDFGLRSIIPETGLERSLLNRMRSFVPDTKTGIMSNYMGQGKMFDPKKMAMNFALSKMGLGWLNPVLGIASMFGFDPLANIGTRFNLPYKKGPDTPIEKDDKSDVTQKTMEASKKKIEPTDQQTAIINETKKRYAELQEVIESGMFGNRRLTIGDLAKLTQVSKQMEAFLVNPEGIMGVS